MDSLMITNTNGSSDFRAARRVTRCRNAHRGQIFAAAIAWSLVVPLTALGQAPSVPGQGGQPVAPPQEQTTPPAGPPPSCGTGASCFVEGTPATAVLTSGMQGSWQ